MLYKTRKKKMKEGSGGKAGPEVALFRAVIIQAITDATGALPSQKNIHYYLASENIRSRARFWLTQNNKDFREVCELAALDPSAVLKMGIELRSRDWPFRFMQPRLPRRYKCRTKP